MGEGCVRLYHLVKMGYCSESPQNPDFGFLELQAPLMALTTKDLEEKEKLCLDVDEVLNLRISDGVTSGKEHPMLLPEYRDLCRCVRCPELSDHTT